MVCSDPCWPVSPYSHLSELNWFYTFKGSSVQIWITAEQCLYWGSGVGCKFLSWRPILTVLQDSLWSHSDISLSMCCMFVKVNDHSEVAVNLTHSLHVPASHLSCLGTAAQCCEQQWWLHIKTSKIYKHIWNILIKSMLIIISGWRYQFCESIT